MSRGTVARCSTQLRARIADGRRCRRRQLDDDSILSESPSASNWIASTQLHAGRQRDGNHPPHQSRARAAAAGRRSTRSAASPASPANLEYDLTHGGRGRREAAIEKLLVELTGAEAATVVNNNAAAVLVAVNSLASGKEVVVSRGELVEIGGAFRIPDILAKSGAVLREVGTTNRTHPADYERAIGPNTGLAAEGAHQQLPHRRVLLARCRCGELVAIGRTHDLPVMEDLGSGALVDLSQFGLPKEPIVAEQVALGADVVTFSGDKILGGPQAGLIVGTTRLVEQMVTENPLHRAVRCGKLTIAALEATLKLYQQSADVIAEIPTLRMLTRPLDEIDETRRRRACPRCSGRWATTSRSSLEDSTSQVGSGALPTDELPTKVIAVESACCLPNGSPNGSAPRVLRSSAGSGTAASCSTCGRSSTATI